MDLNSYALDDSSYDEMFADGGNVRPLYSALAKRLNDLGVSEFAASQRMVEVLLRNQGVTFTVYSDSAGIESVPIRSDTTLGDVAHPGGLAHSTYPKNGLEAESRRNALFQPFGHSPGRHVLAPPHRSLESPLVLDLRLSRA
jgi:uncharacterized protein (DUF2126 family)